MSKILAIDYGQKRVGLAITDDHQLIASGLTTIHSKDIFEYLNLIFSKENISIVVVGVAKNLDNTPSQSSKFIEPFVVKLSKQFPEITIQRVDERFTSKMAFQTMIDAGLKKKDRRNKALVDQISATIILQSFLDCRNR